MRALVQRCRSASVSINETLVSEIGLGAVVLLGVTHSDSIEIAHKLAGKLAALRIFPDDEGVMNRSIVDHGGAILAVSQFTLYADTTRGNRPSYIQAAPADIAEPLYREFCNAIRGQGIETKEGVFGADMDVSLVNWGPVTILLEL
ncbi:MAG: D-aminoacyl-tRNA deacylase [Actinomycetota bacterium]